jgi:hypothetical protein
MPSKRGRPRKPTEVDRSNPRQIVVRGRSEDGEQFELVYRTKAQRKRLEREAQQARKKGRDAFKKRLKRLVRDAVKGAFLDGLEAAGASENARAELIAHDAAEKFLELRASGVDAAEARTKALEDAPHRAGSGEATRGSIRRLSSRRHARQTKGAGTPSDTSHSDEA